MLTDLDLLPVYDSAEHDLVADLIVPLLMNSSSYIRGVGFFTSGWVSVAAQGIARFVGAHASSYPRSCLPMMSKRWHWVHVLDMTECSTRCSVGH